jgi:hypothetical protein
MCIWKVYNSIGRNLILKYCPRIIFYIKNNPPERILWRINKNVPCTTIPISRVKVSSQLLMSQVSSLWLSWLCSPITSGSHDISIQNLKVTINNGLTYSDHETIIARWCVVLIYTYVVLNNKENSIKTKVGQPQSQ